MIQRGACFLANASQRMLNWIGSAWRAFIFSNEARMFDEPRRQAYRPDYRSGRQHRPVIGGGARRCLRSEEHTSELQSLMRISYAVFCLKQKKQNKTIDTD